MKYILNIICCLLCSMSALAAETQSYAYEEVAGDPMQARIYTLPNGLKVYLSVNNEKPRVTAHIAVNTGSRNDPAETTGLAHYLEHLMFKGTQRFGTTNYEAEKPYLEKISQLYEEYRQLTDSVARKAKYHEIDSVSQIAAQYFIPNEYDKMMSQIGSLGTNAYTSYDQTVYVENIPSNEIERWAMVNADRFQHMVMRGFHTELEAVYEEKNISMTKDARKSIEALTRALFPTHPYGTQTTIGTQEHLKNPSQVNIQNYYNKYYRPNNVAICMAGDLDPDKTIAIIAKYFGQWEKGNDVTPPSFPALSPLTEEKDTTVMGQEIESILMGWRTPGAASLTNDTLTMMDMILCNGKVGLIDLNLNQSQKVLSASSGPWSLKDYGMYVMQGVPNEGQTLDEVKALLLEQIEKVKRGEFDEKLMPSILSNFKLNLLNSLDDNKARVSMMVNSFTNGIPWKQEVEDLDRMAKIKKADIVKWANENLGDGFVCVYKLKGEDTTIVKIDKPAITDIPSNRDLQSEFIKEFGKMSVEDIQPQFVDFKKDLSFGKTKTGLPVIYKQNTQDERFSLTYRFEFGSEADEAYNIAESYFDLLGTTTESVEQIKRDFYDIACSYSLSIGGKTISVSVSGLQEYLPQAVEMMDRYLDNVKSDTAVYNKFVEQLLKARSEVRNNQNACFSALQSYASYGEKAPFSRAYTPAQLRETNPEHFTDLIHGLKNYEHKILYWGPASLKDICKEVVKHHKTPKKLAAVPQNKPYEMIETTRDEVLIAPYDAPNINMSALTYQAQPWSVDTTIKALMFNEYFGGSMNGIVFQELRETRGLAYSARASYVCPSRKDEKNYYRETIISQNDKLMDCINTFRQITDTLPQSEQLLATAKQSLMKTLAAARTTKGSVISRYLSAQYLGLDCDINQIVWQQLPALTLQDVVKFEEDNIKGKPRRYCILGKEAELDTKALEQFAPVKRLTLDDIFPAYK